MASLVTLTTDFGTADAYVAELKGVLFSEGPPDLRVVDLSHDQRPFDVHGAALFLRQAVPRFPAGTVHIAVIDPGVGSARKAIAARIDDQIVVGPDNGVFGYLFGRSEQVFEIDPEQLGPRLRSATFHGRDVFAPFAARLAGGAQLEQLATPLDTYHHLVFPMVECTGDVVVGKVIHVDRYGNLVTNIAHSVLAGFFGGALDHLSVHVGERAVQGIVGCYADVKPNELLALWGSSALLEVAQREGSAAERLNVQVGKLVRVSRI